MKKLLTSGYALIIFSSIALSFKAILVSVGSVIVDLAAGQGGNCALTKAGHTVEHHQVTIMGPLNLPATIPVDASRMYSKNITTFFKHLYPKPDAELDFADEIVKGSCITRDGQIVNEQVKAALD